MAASKPRCQSWPDLPPDPLGLVLCRLPSLADCVRLRAACRQWRFSARLQPLPPLQLPWLAFRDGTLLDVANNTAHRVRLPGDACCYSAGDNIFFLVHDDGRCSLMNAFSNAMTPLPELAAILQTYKVNPRDERTPPIRKVVMSSKVDSSPNHPLIAVVVNFRVIVSTCRPAGEINSCLLMDGHFIVDIALFQEKIYVLTDTEELLALELGNGRLDKPTPPGVKPAVRSGTACIENPITIFDYLRSPLEHRRQDIFSRFEGYDDDDEIRRYLVESNGKLLMVKRWVSKPSRMLLRMLHKDIMERTHRFEVLEADLGDGRPRLGRWKKVDGLNGRALFVGTPLSKSVPAGQGEDGAREDCVYFVHQYIGRKPDDPLGDSGVYSMRDRTITPLLPETTAPLPWDSRRFPAWFFPVEV